MTTTICKSLLAVLALAGNAQAAPVPVAVTGYTADVVADGTGTAASRTTLDFDGVSFALMAVGYTNPTGAVATSGLPASGLITSATNSGATYQLAPYTANNSLRLATAGTGALTFTTARTAGDVYVLASSGSGSSTMVVTVTFTDGTTQVFPATTVGDWYGGTGAAIVGIGRVSVADNAITNSTVDPRLYEFRYTISAANVAKSVQSVSFNKTSATGLLNIMGISVTPLCTGTPTAGTAVASAANTCAAAAIVLSLTGASADGGVGYQWQASTNGGTTFTDIAGATGTTYTVAGQTMTTQYRARLTCSVSGLSATSTAVTISSTPPTYATLPVTESFENTWLDGCATRDVPSASWRNTPATGNNSWRRDDDGTSAPWTLPTSYLYTPVSSQGSRSARFHSGYTMSGIIGTLDLYVNLSTVGAKRLSFDINNSAGADSLIVQLSTDGGVTFSRLAGYGVTGPGFVTQVLPISATSATSIVRFRGRGDYQSNDIGLDNLILESATGCLTPASLTATATTTTATLSWLTGGTGTYTVRYGITGFNPTTGGTVVTGLTGPPYTITGLTPGTTYQFYVTLNCAGGSNSGTAGPVTFNTQIVNDEPCGATVLTVNNTCTPLATTNLGATTTPSTVYGTGGQGTGCGTNNSPRDVWFSFVTAATGPTSTAVRITVTGNPASVLKGYSGAACTGPLTYLSCAGTATNLAAPNLDLNNLTPSTTYYVRVSDYVASSTLGNFTICATPVPNCPAPSGLTASNPTSNTATLSWTGTSGGTGSTYTVIYGPTGFLPASGGTTVSGITGTSTAITGLLPTTGYQFYVQQVCGGFNGSSTLTGPFSFTTPLTVPTNDDPCGALPLSATARTATNVGSTTTTLGNIALPGCAGGALPKDVWFSFAASATTSTLTFTGAAAGAVRVYTSPSCSAGPFASVFCQGSNANNTTLGSVPVTGLTAGTRYYVAVSGFGSSDTPGSFTVSATNVLASRNAAAANALLVYPNPSNTGQLTLQLGGLTGARQATLVNALGQVVLTTELRNATEQTLTTRGLAAGVYTLRVQAGAEVLTRKVVLD